MSKSNPSNLLELLEFEHAGQKTPGGRADKDRVIWTGVEQEGGVGDGDSVQTKLGDQLPGHTADGGARAH